MSLFELSERVRAVVGFTAFLISTGPSLPEIFSYKDNPIKNQYKQNKSYSPILLVDIVQGKSDFQAI